MGCFRLVENPPANMFLDSFSHQWCQSRLFSMLVTVPPQPKHNTVCSRLLSLTFSPMLSVQGCKWDVYVHQCSAACVEMHFPNSFQPPFLQMPYACSTYYIFWPLSLVPEFTQILRYPKGSIYIYKSTD